MMDSKTHNQLQTLVNIIVDDPNAFEDVFFMLGSAISPGIRDHAKALQVELEKARARDTCAGQDNGVGIRREDLLVMQETLGGTYPETAGALSSALARKNQQN